MLNDDRGGIVKYLLIVLGAVALVFAILVAIGAWYTSGMMDNAQAFFDRLMAGDYEGAYALTSTEFRKATTIEDLKARTEGGGMVGIEWEGRRSAEDGRKALDAVIVTDAGVRGPVSVTMIKEGDAWRVFAVDPRAPEEEEAEAVDDDERLEGYSWGINWSTARIADAFMTRDIGTESIKRADAFPADIERIYCAVKLANAPDDTDVTARWIFVGGPKSDLKDYEMGTVTQQPERGAYLTFVAARPEQGFPEGDYVVKLFVNGKKKKTLSFKVGG